MEAFYMHHTLEVEVVWVLYDCYHMYVLALGKCIIEYYI